MLVKYVDNKNGFFGRFNQYVTDMLTTFFIVIDQWIIGPFVKDFSTF